MKRVGVPEFEDFPWFPGWLRACMTHNIVIMARLMGVGHALTRLISPVLNERGIDHVVDLGSGAGGVMPDIVPELSAQAGHPVRLTLSDKFPNPDALETFNSLDSDAVRYSEVAVDATDFTTAPEGLKTMVNCFHHFEPPAARAILASAAERRQPLLIYEMAGHQTAPFPVWFLTLPIGLTIVFFMAFLKSALVRPITFNQIFFTYVIPLVPFFYAWDGQASMPRIYRLEDLDELTAGLETPGYTWQRGYGESSRGGRLGTYLLGLPTEA